MNILKKVICLISLFVISNSYLNAQCGAGEIEILLTTGGGTYDSELWVNVTTGPNGTGSVLWAQGNGTIGNSAGPLTNESICAVEGTTYYVNTYDEWGDGWNGATFTITTGGSTIVTSAGSPDDGDGVGGSGGWDGLPGEFESSEIFTASAPLVPIAMPSDVCEDDALFEVIAPTAYDATSGKAGLAIVLVTDAWASEISFDLYDLDGNLMYDETSFPGAPGSLSNNTVYTIFDNECFDVSTTAGIPDQIDIFDSSSDGIYDNAGGFSGAGVYIYYYAADAIEVFNNDDNGNGIEYIAPGTGAFPSFYTAATNKRTATITHTGASMTGLFPGPSLYEYVSMGTWSGTGAGNQGTVTKTYFGGFAGLARTITVPNGTGTYTPSVPVVGANSSAVFTYNSVYGSAGPASCNVATVTNYEVDVHARPTITPVTNQPCNAGTYDVTLDVDLGTYNVSVDEDGITAFTVTGSGGTLSTTSLTGTGTTQVTISNIPSGSGWSINVNDVSGITCGLTGTNGNCASVLPIELLSFWGENRGNHNQLNWITSTEINNDYFILEKSVDGIKFEKIEGEIAGAGNSLLELSYDKTDKNPYDRTYYRLKQVDFDGRSSFSKVIVIENTGSVVVKLEVYPNPVKKNITLRFRPDEIGFTKINLINALGQSVYSNILETQEGLNKHAMNIENLPSGVYFVTVKMNNRILTEKITKQ